MSHDENLETQGKAMSDRERHASTCPQETSAAMLAECRRQSVIVASADKAEADLLTLLDEVAVQVEHWTN